MGEPRAAGTVRFVIRGRRVRRGRVATIVLHLPRRRGRAGLTASRSRDDPRISQGLRARTGLVRVDTLTRFPARREPGSIRDHLVEAKRSSVFPVASNPVSPWIPGSCPRPRVRSHTARYPGGEVTIHYPFHPRSGQRVQVVRRHRFRDTRMLVIRQPGGTLAQIPIWMCAPSAARMAVSDRPCLSVEGLRDLRLALEAILSSLPGTDRGERRGACAGCATGGAAGVDGAVPTARPGGVAAIPLLAALSFEAVEAEAATPTGGGATTGGRDEQDRV